MKITVWARTGDVTIDTNGSEPKAVAELLRELQRPEKARQAPAEPAPEMVEEARLSEVKFAVWEWLVAHDAETGRSIQEVADGIGRHYDVASNHLRELVNTGVVYRVSRGLYRAGEG